MSVRTAGPFLMLVEELLHSGFTTVDDYVSENGSGNSLLLLQRGATRLRVVKDRGQWFLEIAASGPNNWFEAAPWAAMLDDQMSPLHPWTIEESTAFVRDRLDEIDQASLDDSGRTLGLLISWRKRRKAARHALPDSDWKWAPGD